MNEPQFYKGAIDATGSISNAWNLIKDNYWLYFAIALVASLIVGAVGYIPIAGGVVSALLAPPVMGGVYYIALRAMRREPVDFGMMFKGFEKAGPLFTIGLISSIPTIIFTILDVALKVTEVLVRGISGSGGANRFQSGGDIAVAGGVFGLVLIILVVYLIFSILWGITFAFAVPIAMDQDVDAITALKLSARSSWGNFGGVLVLIILSALMLFGGAIVCCIGIFFVLPIVEVAWAFAYRQVFPDLGPTTAYRNEPPPPDTYQGSFGHGL
jgi:uncharacterized membrane protein